MFTFKKVNSIKLEGFQQFFTESPRGNPKIQETGFLREFKHPHRDIAKKPGFWIPTRKPQNPRNRVSARIYASPPRYCEETRFL